MKVVLFGASGMIGHGVLLECLEDAGVSSVVSLVRRPSGIRHDKLEEIVHQDFTKYDAVEAPLQGAEACFYCLGVSSVGMTEAEYTRITYDYAVAAARTLARLNPSSTFCFVSGGGTDSSEQGRTMWARVKGKTENAVLGLFERGYAFRPGFILPLKGAVSRTPWLRVFYLLFRPLFPLLRALFPGLVTSTEKIGRAMLASVRRPPTLRVLEVRDINALAEG